MFWIELVHVITLDNSNILFGELDYANMWTPLVTIVLINIIYKY